MSYVLCLIPKQKAKEDILKVYKKRKLGFERFAEEKICSHTISFSDPIKQNKLKSFNTKEMVKKELTKLFPVKADRQNGKGDRLYP